VSSPFLIFALTGLVGAVFSRRSLMPWRLRSVRSATAASPTGIGRAGVRWGVAFAPQLAALLINVAGWPSLIVRLALAMLLAAFPQGRHPPSRPCPP
jgi:hypothetical protein